ncbi:MAG TPA: trypsin-like peptidase domain-containing protein, partial [Acidimicrobiales bacterium]
MSDHRHPTHGPEESDPGTPPTGGTEAGAPAQQQATPSMGTAIPLPAAGANPDAVYPQPDVAATLPPTGPTPSVGPGAPTPPRGAWTPPAGSGWTPGPAVGVPVGGGWSGGATPPEGGWPAAGFPPPPPHQPPPAKRTGLVVGLASVVVVAAVLAGAGLGHEVWPSDSTNHTAESPTFNVPGSSGSSGSSGGTTSPFGNGSSGSETSPFGGSSSGNSSTGAGAPSNISAIAAKVSPALVDINTNLSYQNEQAAGTGMVLTANGVILTNNHVIDGATTISVTDVGNGKSYDATVVGYDRTGDIAVLRLVGASGLQTITTSSGSAAVGQAVVGVGNAGGTGGTPSSAGGSITALNQSITASDDSGGNSENLTGLIEVNAGIQPGDSGGSLVNTSGQVIGMDTAASAGSGYQVSGAQAYAIPIATALTVAKQIQAGKASATLHIGATGFLGVSVRSASSASSGGFGVGGLGGGSGSTSTSGATVEETLSGSAAAKAGV